MPHRLSNLIRWIALLLAVLTTASRPLPAQAPTAIAPMHFHHVHLNSVDPTAAAAYYPKAFPISAVKTTYNGYEAVKTGNVYILFTKVSATPPNDDINILIRPWPGGGLVSPRGHIVDHWALSVADLEPTVARLKSEGIKFLEEIHPWGNTRAAMIEGPDRVAIELVEVK
jgi:catechol 2,3-dioxygenase-like lactoylglutathione lyase family enzyme